MVHSIHWNIPKHSEELYHIIYLYLPQLQHGLCALHIFPLICWYMVANTC